MDENQLLRDENEHLKKKISNLNLRISADDTKKS